LLLRQDNADRRLTPVGRQVGLVDDQRWRHLEEKLAAINIVTQTLESFRVDGITLAQLLRRPETTWETITGHLPHVACVDAEIADQVTYDVKYAGYVQRQQQQVDRQQRLAEKRIPENFDYARIAHLRTEARQKLTRIQPVSLAQASRISGITPADIALLMAHLQRTTAAPANRH